MGPPTRQGQRRRWNKAPAELLIGSDLISAHPDDDSYESNADTGAEVGTGSPSTRRRSNSNPPASPSPHSRHTSDPNMNPANFPQRQAPRLQNTSKTGLGNGLVGGGGAGAGWGGGLGATGGGLGYGGGGLASGLGQPQRPSQLSGFAQVMGGGGSQGLDMSDFPSLSGGPRSSNAPPGSLNYNAVRQTLGQQPAGPPSQPQQQQVRAPSTAPSLPGSVDGQAESRSISQQRPRPPEEFPALGGRQQTLNGDHVAPSLTSPATTNAPQQTTLPMRDASNSAFQPPQQQQQAPIGSSQQQLPNGAQAVAQAAGSGTNGAKKYADMSDREKYGLTALTAALETRQQREAGHPENVDLTLPPAYRSNIFMGHQLDSLDLDLNSSESILPTFHVWGANGTSGSQFDYRDRMTVPDYTLPSAYQVGNVPPIEGRMDALSDETLFFIFFSQPRDVAQQRAAAELERRDWRWHKVLRQWLRRDTPQQNFNSTSLAVVDLAPRVPVGTAPQPIPGTTQERGVYVFFDAPNWRRVRREFVLEHNELDHGDAGAALSAGTDGGFGAGAQQIARTWSVGAMNGSGGVGFGGPVQPPGASSVAGNGVGAQQQQAIGAGGPGS